jgi:hypothetical protein
MKPSIETPHRGDATAIRTENLTKTYPGVFEAVKRSTFNTSPAKCSASSASSAPTEPVSR